MKRKAYFSRSMRFFRDRYTQKYNLEEYQGDGPIVMFGMYLPEDYEFYSKHDDVMVLWCGSDAMVLNPPRVRIIKNRKARHVVSGKFTHDDLSRLGIEHEIIPFTPAMPDIKVKPRGDAVYHYGTFNNDFYKNSWIHSIRRKTGLRIISADKNTYSHDALMGVYEDCFMGLRLTDHDGLPNTVLELGLMGRRCIYNGGLPHSIPWAKVDDICQNIEKEYKKKDEPNEHIGRDVFNYIDIGDEWLHT